MSIYTGVPQENEANLQLYPTENALLHGEHGSEAENVVSSGEMKISGWNISRGIVCRVMKLDAFDS